MQIINESDESTEPKVFAWSLHYNNAEQRCGCPSGRHKTDCSRATAGAVMRSGRLTIAIAADEAITWTDDTGDDEDKAVSSTRHH